MRFLSFLFGLFFLLFSATSLQAQLNLKVGYSLGVMNPSFTNQIMKSYNQENPWLDQKLKDLNLMNGLMIGFRNRWEYIGLELSWTSKIAERDAAGLDPSLNANIQRFINWRYSSFSGGLEIIIDDVSIGATLDASDIAIKTEYTGSDGEEVILDDFFLSSHLYVNYEIKTGTFLAIAFRPYIQIPWKRVSVYDFEQHLFPDSPSDPADFDENYFNFGLMFIFFNGNHDR